MGKPKFVLDLPVEFGGVSFGDQTARLGVVVSRDRLNLDAADESLCNHRLNGRVAIGGFDDAPGQGTFEFDSVVEGMFDVKTFGVSSKAISFGLTFGLNDIDRGDLAEFAKTKGRLQVELVSQIPDKAKSSHADDEDDDEPEDGTDLEKGPSGGRRRETADAT